MNLDQYSSVFILMQAVENDICTEVSTIGPLAI